MKSSRFLCLFSLLALLLAACGGDAASEGDVAASDAGDAAAESDMASADSGMDVAEVVLRPAGDTIAFDEASTSFTVQSGQTVNLTLENVATLDIMLHNVVILSSNEDDVANRVGMAAIAAGEASGFVPEDEAILAATPLAQPGETVQVTFEAPSEPGTYRYICTYIGHHTLMQGTMIVT
ncbi:MAG: hypothetical protein F4Y00_01625 [Bacteroidetes bacterium SB0662_bin_6]|nr:hypothetical protein [Bacteroidetes bacterium SB0668_bin_1]MYE03665.1 hypothetical protein [Bacteroidetes bacterium SB0662_bin_6]